MVDEALKRKIIEYANELGDIISAQQVEEKFAIHRSTAVKALKELHKDGELMCEDGCDRCDV